jgi:hypothetical protein
MKQPCEEPKMPRKKLALDPTPRSDRKLSDRLVQELKSSRESGHPLIYEAELGADRLRVLVIWDEWDGVPLEERTAAILDAFDRAEGNKYRKRIALASGLTVPEATATGMLPYQVGTALRKDDPVTLEQCRAAMLAEGASRLFGPDVLQLRFATLDEAEACRQRLIKSLPKSDNVWIITKDISVQEGVSFSESAPVERA